MLGGRRPLSRPVGRAHSLRVRQAKEGARGARLRPSDAPALVPNLFVLIPTYSLSFSVSHHCTEVTDNLSVSIYSYFKYAVVILALSLCFCIF